MNSEDPVASNPEHYRVLFENEHVRVLDYTDTPGVRTTPALSCHHTPPGRARQRLLFRHLSEDCRPRWA